MSVIIQSIDKDVRTRINEALVKYNLKQIDLAKETGVHHSTLSLWLQGKVKGTHIKIEDQMEKWLSNLTTSKPKLIKQINKLHLLKGKKERVNFDFIENNINNLKFGNLIPINIYIELEGKKFKDLFFWELNEPYLYPETFAKILTEENNLSSSFEVEILNQLNKQILQYQTIDYMEGEVIKIIKLEIRLGDKLLTDQFEWDINYPYNKPEEFAFEYCKDLGLGTEFMLPIAHSIREQIINYRKGLISDKKFMTQYIERQKQNNTYNSTKNYAYNNQFNNIDNNNTISLSLKEDMSLNVSEIDNNKNDNNNNNNNNNNNYDKNFDISYFRDQLSDLSEWSPNIKVISNLEIQKYEQKEERKSRYAQRKKY